MQNDNPGFPGFTFKMLEGVHGCERHGDVMTPYIQYQDGRIKWQMCPECVREADEALLKKQQTEELRIAREKWSASNIKPRFFNAEFSDYVASTESQKQALACFRHLADGTSNRSMLLTGDNGLGKTMLASIAVKHRGGFIYKMYEIIIRIKASYKPNSDDDEQDILDRLSKAPLLVIDEVGKQFGSESERNWLSYVIDERYEADRPTVLLSNLKLMRDCDDTERAQGMYIERYLGRDSVSRLIESADIMTITGSDWRREHRQTAESLSG